MKKRPPHCERAPREIDVLLGRQIQHRREARGLTIADVASPLNIAERRLSDFEAGTVRPSPKEVVAIADALEIAIVDIFTRALDAQEREKPEAPQTDVNSGAGGPQRIFLNLYHCDNCGNDWIDEAPCIREADCEGCGSGHVAPYRSESFDWPATGFR